MFSRTPLTNEMLVELQKVSYVSQYWPPETPTTANEGVNTFPFGADGRHAHARASTHTSSSLIHGALLFSLLAIVLLLTLCSSMQRKEKLPPLFLLHRSLSERSDSPPFHECAATTTGDTDSSSEMPASFSGDEETYAADPEEEEEPTAKKVRLESAAPAGSTEGADSSAGPPSPPLTDVQNVAVPELQQKPLERFFQPQPQPGLPFLSSPPSPQPEGPLPSYNLPQGRPPQVRGVSSLKARFLMAPGERSADEVAAAEALLLLLQPPPPAAGSATIHEEEQREQEELHPAGPERERGAASGAVFIGPGEVPSAAGPSAPPATPEGHFFVRVPGLKPGVTTRAFDARRARGEDLTVLYPSMTLSMLQSLLAEKTLDEHQAQAVLILAEQMMAHCLQKETAELTRMKPCRAAEVLGMRFLFFDSIIAALTAVGQRVPDELWNQLAAAVPHTFFSRPDQSPYTPYIVRFTAALEILKTGNRPPPAELIGLKRMMFCSGSIIKRFHHQAFDLWRRHCDDSVPTGPANS